MPLNHVFVEVGRDISDRAEIDRGTFRRLVMEFVGRAYPRAEVIVVFNDLLPTGRIDLGVRGDTQHERIVRHLMDRASERSRRRARS